MWAGHWDEHFSIWYALRDIDKNLVDHIYITASGGPFLNKPLKRLKNANIKQATNHPNWKMGKKISIDSATMMNKVFEIIEAKKIFELDLVSGSPRPKTWRVSY